MERRENKAQESRIKNNLKIWGESIQLKTENQQKKSMKPKFGYLRRSINQ